MSLLAIGSRLLRSRAPQQVSLLLLPSSPLPVSVALSCTLTPSPLLRFSDAQFFRSLHSSPLSYASKGGNSGSSAASPPTPSGGSSSHKDHKDGPHGLPTPADPTPPFSSSTQQPISQLYRYAPKTSLAPSLSLSDLTRPGGRQSVSGVVATVFGSSGFIGRYVVNHLGRIGSQVIVPYRGDGMNSRHLRLNGDLGQIVPVPFDMFDEESIVKAVNRSNVVINCIGSRYETANFKYDDVNFKIAHRLAKISKQMGVTRFIHMSCYGAAPDAESSYFQSKFKVSCIRLFTPPAARVACWPACTPLPPLHAPRSHLHCAVSLY